VETEGSHESEEPLSGEREHIAGLVKGGQSTAIVYTDTGLTVHTESLGDNHGTGTKLVAGEHILVVHRVHRSARIWGGGCFDAMTAPTHRTE
jgi:hypothetical protein